MQGASIYILDTLAPCTKNDRYQMEYTNRLDHFGQFISFLSSIPTYTPNEEDLKIITLNSFLSELKTTNLDVTSSGTEMNMIRRATRNEVFKHQERGIALLEIENCSDATPQFYFILSHL